MKKNSICKIIVSGLLAAVPLMGMAVMAWNFKLCWMYMMHTVIRSFLIMLWLMLIQ